MYKLHVSLYAKTEWWTDESKFSSCALIMQVVDEIKRGGG